MGLIAALAVSSPAPAPADASVIPIVDCMVPQGGNVFSVFFGYVNNGPQTAIGFGDTNQIVPGIQFQGQPTVFNHGSYPRVLSAEFNANAFSGVSWELDGNSSFTTTSTPLCSAGATGPASDLAPAGATVNGVVNSEGVDTAYYFDYGTTIAYGQATPERHLTSTAGTLVSEPLAGLAPGTTYHYRLVASGPVTTVGEDRTLDTPALPTIPPQPTAPTPVAGEDPVCGILRAKLKHAGKRSKRRSIRSKLRARAC